MKEQLNLILLLLLFFSIQLQSQIDSVKSYNLDEVTVQSGILIEIKPISKISKEKIISSDAVSLSEISKRIPSVKVQKNSRGESQIYFRGSSTRQLTLFFDGVPLNIPWDNRIDLSLMPTSAIESMEITKGIPSIVYGANSIAGIVNIKSINAVKKSHRLITMRLGENNYRSYSGTLADNIGRFNFALSLSSFHSDGFNLPESFNDSENMGKLRLNSATKSLNSFAKFGYKFSTNSSISISFSYKNSKKDVPSEIGVSNPRYWKYPVWKHLSSIINGSHSFTSGSNISYSFLITKFRMQIDQYESDKYLNINDSEVNNDNTIYGRFVYSTVLNKNSLIKIAASGLSSDHHENYLSEDNVKYKFSQNVFSSGLEYEYLSNGFSTIAGIGVDGQSTPNTGLFPSKDPILDYSANILLSYKFSSVFNTQISVGRKTRFPTLREMFSGALGKFVPNPELKSEIAYSGVFSLGLNTGSFKSNLNFFLSFIQDGIVRTTINDSQFMRINETEIRNYGVEFSTDFSLGRKASINFNFSYLNSYGKNIDGVFSDTLEYKPMLILNGSLDFNLTNKLSSLIELSFIGEEYAIKQGSLKLEKLDDYLLVNTKISYILNLFSETKLVFFIRANNIFDKLYYTQWGLPEVGREFFTGVKLAF